MQSNSFNLSGRNLDQLLDDTAHLLPLSAHVHLNFGGAHMSTKQGTAFADVRGGTKTPDFQLSDDDAKTLAELCVAAVAECQRRRS